MAQRTLVTACVLLLTLLGVDASDDKSSVFFDGVVTDVEEGISLIQRQNAFIDYFNGNKQKIHDNEKGFNVEDASNDDGAWVDGELMRSDVDSSYRGESYYDETSTNEEQTDYESKSSILQEWWPIDEMGSIIDEIRDKEHSQPATAPGESSATPTAGSAKDVLREPPPCEAQFVVHVGLPRTGTSSWVDWMKQLGYHGWHLGYPGSTTDAAASGHNDGDDLIKKNTFGVPDDNFFKERLWQTKPEFLSAGDSPWSYLACHLYQLQPRPGMTKFILMERDPIRWHESVMNMYCHFSNPKTHPGRCNINAPRPSVEDNELYFWHDMKWQWCQDDKAKFCERWEIEGMDSSERFKADHAAFVEYQRNHSDLVQQCVPPSDLLITQLEDEDKDKKMADWLGCNFVDKPLPKFPRMNAFGVEFNSRTHESSTVMMQMFG